MLREKLGGTMSFTDNSEWRQSEKEVKSNASTMVPLIILLAAVIGCLLYTVSLVDTEKKPEPQVELNR